MRKLYFQQITDSRFTDNALEDLHCINVKLKELLQKEDNIIYLKITEPKFIDFIDSIQYRSDYYIQKNNKITWNYIYSLINSIKAARYKFI